MIKHAVRVGRKNYILTERNLQKQQAQGGAAISRDRVGVRGGRQDQRDTVNQDI